MEDFIGLIVVALFYLLSASASKKKKKAKRMSRGDGADEVAQRLKRIKEEAKRAEERRSRENQPADRPQILETANPDLKQIAHREAQCRSENIHLHQVTQEQFAEAEEGEDPCHRGGEDEAMRADAEMAYTETEPEAPSGMAQEILRGVIMSEILTRPEQRRAMQKKRWRA